jgi:hypothetical protein
MLAEKAACRVVYSVLTALAAFTRATCWIVCVSASGGCEHNVLPFGPVLQRPAPSSCSSPGCTTLLFVRLLRWGELRRWYATLVRYVRWVNRDRS